MELSFSGRQFPLFLLCWIRECCFSSAMSPFGTESRDTHPSLCCDGTNPTPNGLFRFGECFSPGEPRAQQCQSPGGKVGRGCTDFWRNSAGEVERSVITYARSSWQRLKGFLINSQRQIRIQQRGSWSQQSQGGNVRAVFPGRVIKQRQRAEWDMRNCCSVKDLKSRRGVSPADTPAPSISALAPGAGEPQSLGKHPSAGTSLFIPNKPGREFRQKKVLFFQLNWEQPACPCPGTQGIFLHWFFFYLDGAHTLRLSRSSSCKRKSGSVCADVGFFIFFFFMLEPGLIHRSCSFVFGLCGY